MRGAIIGLLILSSAVAVAQNNALTPPQGSKSLVITFKDGHQQVLSADQISRVEFIATATGNEYPGRFRGRWKVGTSVGSDTFYITLDNKGNATKTLGAAHGTWTVVGEEARITWDDGWKDAIRRVGNKYEKFAYEPGKSFSDPPSNVTSAVNTTPN